ncbi:aldo/keto reductase [Paenibacillus swuensis]|uniref:aldo/keto reductase n=1 Tax=Paenibacillus swuensis TaxID=1178515 RepID=UPI0008380AF1|nr:aldo/keto reductase [Paenibacillus swuensis]
MKSKLGLGGHSFYSSLANEPVPSEQEQLNIVQACLDSGVDWFDTTYAPERIALGRCLQKLGRREEARVAVWNFFTDSTGQSETPAFVRLEEHHLAVMLEELKTDYVDLLVVHAHGDREGLKRELALAESWLRRGQIKGIGIGMCREEHLKELSPDSHVTTVFAPCNYFHQESLSLFEEAKRRGIGTFALSPFQRGWKLEQNGSEPAKTSELLLRWLTSQPHVDQVIVSMRRTEWIDTNRRAEQQGPLTEEQLAVLQGWQ